MIKQDCNKWMDISWHTQVYRLFPKMVISGSELGKLVSQRVKLYKPPPPPRCSPIYII